MDIEFLNNFMVMAECDSVSQAARKLYVAQSAMSNRLKALEKECGAELIERDHHTFRLTESGRILYERARKIVELYDATINDVRGADDGTSGTLNIAVTPSLATGVMRDALCEFNRRYPAVSVKLFEGATPSLLARIEDGVADIALVRTPFTGSAAYETMTIDYDKMMVLSTETLPETMDFAKLLSMKLVLTHRYAAMLSRIAERLGLSLNAPVCCEEIATCISLAETGVGATMIPASTFVNHKKHGLQLNHAELSESECDTRCELVYLKNHRLSRAAKNFAEILMQ